MNTWEIRKTAIVEADDFSDKFDRNGLNYLFYWKVKYPNFKITLFTIPDRTSEKLLNMINDDWFEFAVHGWDHESNFECYGWDYDKAKILLSRAAVSYSKIFKAPGWTITPDYCGYPANPEDLINGDKQAVYKALMDLDFIVMDRHYNKPARPEGLKVVCMECNSDIVHTHTWNMMSPNENERNGFEQVEMRGVPWNNETEFYTIGEAWQKGLIKECQK